MANKETTLSLPEYYRKLGLAYQLFHVDKAIPPIYLGAGEPKVALQALRSLFR